MGYNNATLLPPTFLVYLEDYERHIFMSIYVILTIFSLIGNLAAINSIVRRNYRYIQKSYIVSLAISDILSTIAIAAINIAHFYSKRVIWPLGSFLCSFLPMCQMLGVLTSSASLTFIAMDRYRNVVLALNNGWNPPLKFCLAFITALWLICCGMSYPLYGYYYAQPISINDTEIIETWMCLVNIHFDPQLKTYWVTMTVLIFFPLFFIFLWFNYSVASLVWKHRKPLSSIFHKKSNVKSKLNDVRVERKIRTFKIILTLMIVFIICRLPYYITYLLKVSVAMYVWEITPSFMAFHLVSCCLNPLLYTFLNQTLKIWDVVRRNFLQICCFCCYTSEFDDFEKENPFADCVEKKENAPKY